MPLLPNGIAPYAPASSILGLIERARDRGLPTPVTKEVLQRSGIPESLISRTLQALQLLELINDDGTSSENLEVLRRCPEVEFQPRLAEIIRAVYADIFKYIDPAKDSATGVRDAFRSFTPHGQQDRMVTLFLGLCQKAGIISGDTQQKTIQREKRLVKKVAPQKPTSMSSPSTAHVPHYSSAGLAPPIAGLLAALPKDGAGWNQQDRDRFMDAFGTIINFCIPIRDQEPDKSEEETE